MSGKKNSFWKHKALIEKGGDADAIDRLPIERKF